MFLVRIIGLSWRSSLSLFWPPRATNNVRYFPTSLFCLSSRVISISPLPAREKMVVAAFSRRVGTAMRESCMTRRASLSEGWFTDHMVAATHAILERIPLVDLLVEVRDARVPLSSSFEPLRRVSCPHKWVILLNKVDLADRSQTKKWIQHLKEQNCICCGVNSHNRENIKELLKFVGTQIKDLKGDESNYTATLMLVGIPNVGKSAIANSMHQIGRISAAEKGKLKHAIVSSLPGETKDISSFKIASCPNIYVLDTPGVLPSEIIDVKAASEMALTGAIKDYLVGESELARYFLAILNSSDGYKHWEDLSTKTNDDRLSLESDLKENISMNSGSDQKRRQYASDHTQDFIVRDVRRTIFETISSFKGNLEIEDEMAELIEHQFAALREAFRVTRESSGGERTVAAKLLNLFRTGRLGRYTLDPVPEYPS